MSGWDWLGVTGVVAGMTIALNPGSGANLATPAAQAGQNNGAAVTTPLPGNIAKWFATSKSIGPTAICLAEGNCSLARLGNQVQIRKTSLYGGHTDPGNFVKNFGWCSDQGRSGGDLTRADRMCLERTAGRLPVIISDMKAAGLNPEAESEATINAADLYNQASPVHSRRFPKALVEAKQRGLAGTEAIVWARVKSFYNNGRNEASGLLGICRRERRPVSDWDCVAHDQRRRSNAIALALRTFSAAGVTEGQ